MGTIWVKELRGGLDARRLPETTEGGVLIKGEDGHITSGGEFKKRAAFVPTYTLPTGTVNLAATSAGLVVFGHASSPTMPSGVSYQRLQNGAETLVRVKSFDLFAGKIYAVAEFGDGSIKHYYDGAVVTDWVDGRARGSFDVTGGDGTSTIMVTVNGVEIMDDPVTWGTSHSATAAAIAEEINTSTTSPEYTAVADGPTVSVVAPVGTAYNGLKIRFTLVNDFETDRSSVTLSGGSNTASTPGTYVKTFGTKVHTVAGPLEVFSGVNAPTNWSSAVGYGFVDMSQQTSGMETLTALCEYQDKLAVFADRVIQVWTFVSDPAASVKGQTLRNTGTSSPRSVVKFGDADVFYVDASGIRSLRARDSSLAPSTNDTGVYIDPLVVTQLRTLTTLERETKVIGLIEPVSGRLWMIMKDVIYVFSFFPGSKVSAWTTYTPHYFDGDTRVDFTIDDAVVWNRRVYLRSGDKIIVYGGLSTGAATDATEAVAWLPYLDGSKPWEKKRWTGWDAAVSGTWTVDAAMSLEDHDTSEELGQAFQTTYNDENLALLAESTHISLRFRSSGTGDATLSACAVHFEDKDGGK